MRAPDQRMGSGLRDAEEVMTHAFFTGIDWAALDRREIVPPFNPNVDDAMDLRNFDPEFVNEPVPSSILAAAGATAVSARLCVFFFCFFFFFYFLKNTFVGD